MRHALRRAVRRLLAALPAALLAACGGDPAPAGPPPVATAPAALTSPAAALGPGERACLVARDAAGAPVASAGLAWTLRDDEAPLAVARESAAGAEPARLAADGCVEAPATVPWTRVLTVVATPRDGAAPAVQARVLLVPARTASAGWTLWEPRAVDLAAPDTVRVTVVADRDLRALRLTFLDGSAALPFERLGPRVFRLPVPGARLVAGYHVDETHATVGSIEETDAAGAVQTRVAAVNVRDAGAPAVGVTRLDAHAQRTPYVLNLRVDAPLPETALPEHVRAAYAHLADAYDFVALVDQVQRNRNRHYQGVRNDVDGLGMTRFDRGAEFGSAARLQGIIRFPLDPYFDGASKAMSHEIGHRWMNFSSLAALRGTGGHWPVGDVSYGVMGFGIPGSGAGGTLPFTFARGADGVWRARTAPVAERFNALELYYMGLAPASEVPPQAVFADQTQFTSVADGQALRGDAVTLRVEDLIAAQGARVPAFGQAPTTFRLATVVLSAGRLLTPAELAFFDRQAARAEATRVLPSSEGYVRQTATPFAVATGGRARLISRL